MGLPLEIRFKPGAGNPDDRKLPDRFNLENHAGMPANCSRAAESRFFGWLAFGKSLRHSATKDRKEILFQPIKSQETAGFARIGENATRPGRVIFLLRSVPFPFRFLFRVPYAIHQWNEIVAGFPAFG